MMPAVKESYDSFTEKLSEAGISSLAIDLRGHGESKGGNYLEFNEEQHQSSIEDVKSGLNYLKELGHSVLFVCGASIGANLALQIITMSDAKKAILLSPGINYKGIEAVPLAKQVSSDKEVYIVASRDDVRRLGTCADQGQQIFDKINSVKEIKIFETGGHGTDIFNTHPGFMDELVGWLLG